MGNLRICFISPKFSNHIGGMETHAQEFVSFFLKKKGYKIGSIFTRKSVDDGISAPLRINPQEVNSLLFPVLEGDFKKDSKLILEKSDPNKDMYYLNSPSWLPALVLIKKDFPNMRIIVRSGGNDIIAGWVGSEKDSLSKLEDSRHYMVQLINEYVEKLIVNSDYSRNRILSVGVKPEKVVKIVGGVDCDKFRPNKKGVPSLSSNLEIVTTARLVKFKGIEYCLRAIKEAIKNFGLDLKYTIIGDGPEKENLEKLTRELGISGNVRFLGAVNLDDIPFLISNKHIFLHLPIHFEKIERGSSYIHTETMGRSLCEAAACGIPVVASKVGGIPEIIVDEKTGFLVNEKDYLGAAERIKILSENPALMSDFRKNARKRALTIFDFKIIFKFYEDIFMCREVSQDFS